MPKNGFGFGDDADAADTADFESETAGGNGQADDSSPRDDHSDDVGWDQTTDVKSIEDTGNKAPAKDDEDKGTGVRKTGERMPADDKAKDAPAKKADEDDGEGDDDKPGDDEKADDLPDGVKRRVARANRQRDRLAIENEELRKQLAAKPADKAKDEPAPAPKAEDFDDYEDYLEAKKLHDKPAPKKEEPKPETLPALDDDTARQLKGARDELQATLVDAGHADLFASVGKLDINVTPDMVMALSDPDAIEHPESVLQAFLDKPDLANEIAALKTPAARMKRLAQLDKPYVKAAAKADEDKGKPAPKRDSGAPPPIDETNGNARGAKSYDSLSFHEFEEVRNSEETKSKNFW